MTDAKTGSAIFEKPVSSSSRSVSFVGISLIAKMVWRPAAGRSSLRMTALPRNRYYGELIRNSERYFGKAYCSNEPMAEEVWAGAS